MEDTQMQFELPEIETKIMEMKNRMAWINSRFHITKVKVSEFKHIAIKIIKSKTQRKKEIGSEGQGE